MPGEVLRWYDERLGSPGADPSRTLDHVNEVASGTVAVAYGGDMTFDIAPDSGYEIDTVRVNGAVVVGALLAAPAQAAPGSTPLAPVQDFLADQLTGLAAATPTTPMNSWICGRCGRVRRWRSPSRTPSCRPPEGS